MFSYKGSVYRQALTPDQKKLKREYKLEQYKADDRIPSFEEAWSWFRSGYDNYDLEEALKEIDDVKDDDILEWLEEQGIDVPEEPDDLDYGSTEWYAWKDEVLYPLIEKHRATVEKAMALDHIKDNVRPLYDQAITRVTQWLDGQDCWRAQMLATSVDPAEHPQVGVFWTFEDNAYVLDYITDESDAPPDSKKVIYHARIDLQNINKAETIEANLTFGTGDEGEQEVRFYKGAPIFVYDVTLEDGTVVEINDWRTT